MQTEQSRIPALKREKMKKLNGRRIVYLLIGLFITLLIILFFRSSISKVAQIHITGFDLIAESAIGQASGLAIGDSYFFTSSSTIEKRVKTLKTIESVKVTKKFPSFISIEVKEFQRVAFQVTGAGDMEALLADGSVVSLKGRIIAMDRPIMSNWQDEDPWKAKLCRVLAQIPEALLSDISEIKPNPTVAYEDKIKIYTRSLFEVNTTVGYLLEKIPYLSSLILQTKEDQNTTEGILSLLDSNYGKLFDKDQIHNETQATPSPSP
ncbi:MAG: FtsQ-type POTRA domain-containing protein [Paenibacillaceae bacterium]